MGKEKIVEPYYVTTLTNRVASAASLEYHARILMESFFRRKIIESGKRMVVDALNEQIDVFELSDLAMDRISNMFNKISTDNSMSGKELTRKVLLKIESDSKVKGVLGVTSGMEDIDRITGGWQDSDLIILAARPSMGKTALATQAMINAVKAGKVAMMFSLEMEATKVMTRVISSELGIDSKIISKKPKSIDQKELHERIGKNGFLESEDFIIDDSSGISVNSLITKLKKKNHERIAEGKKKIEVAFVDYLQLLTGNNPKNREQEVSEISRKLKGAAKELNIPIIALSQLSRAVEQRANKKPIMSDLRESGSIEQDADLVMFLVRPEYYGINQTEDGKNTDGLAILSIGKNRNGSIGDINLTFVKHLTKFKNYNSGESIGEETEEGEDMPF